MSHPNLPDPGDNLSDVGIDLQQRIDYAEGEDPIYIGYAKQRFKTSDPYWVIYKLTYSDGKLIHKQRLEGSWDGRAKLKWQS